jgi:hypothetical protein
MSLAESVMLKTGDCLDFGREIFSGFSYVFLSLTFDLNTNTYTNYFISYGPFHSRGNKNIGTTEKLRILEFMYHNPLIKSHTTIIKCEFLSDIAC